jgi:hypothetical protein
VWCRVSQSYAADHQTLMCSTDQLVRPNESICFSATSKQDRQCTYNVTMRRVRESLLPWKRIKYYIFVCVYEWVPGRVSVCILVGACSLPYPAFNTYAPYCNIIYGPSLSTRFFDIISNVTILGKKLLNIKCVF